MVRRSPDYERPAKRGVAMTVQRAEAELKDRIDRQIVVTRDRTGGSRAEIRK